MTSWCSQDFHCCLTEPPDIRYLRGGWTDFKTDFIVYYGQVIYNTAQMKIATKAIMMIEWWLKDWWTDRIVSV